MIVDRVAVTLHYLSHSSSFIQSKNMFGMGKATAIRFVEQVLAVIVDKLAPIHVALPETSAQWERNAQGFEEIGVFPNVAGAIDGSIIPIERPGDYEAWYCRKGYPAINLQAVCDYRKRFMAYAMRPGSCSDKLLFLMSEFGRHSHKKIPGTYHWLADAGYRLTSRILIPFDLYEVMPRDQRKFNYIHSKTRISIECAFGILKERFRIFQIALPFSPARCSKIIVACMVLHNILLDLNDDVVELDQVHCQDSEDEVNVDEDVREETVEGREKRIAIMNYLCRYCLIYFKIIK
jgi:hypothetical protein